MLSNHYDVKSSDISNKNYIHNSGQTFANDLSDDKIYPFTVVETADAQS